MIIEDIIASRAFWSSSIAISWNIEWSTSEEQNEIVHCRRTSALIAFARLTARSALSKVSKADHTLVCRSTLLYGLILNSETCRYP